MNAVLVATLIALAGAAAVVPTLARRIRAVRAMLSVALAATALATVAVPLVLIRVTDGLRQMDGVPTLFVFELKVIGLALVVAGPTLSMAGVVLPTVFEWLTTDRGDVHGRWWGTVLAANVVGGMVGAELTHRLLVPTAGFYVSAGIIGGAYAAAALVPGLSTAAGRLRWTSAMTAVAALATVAGLTATLLQRLPDMWEGLQYRVLSRATGREGLIAVVEHEIRGRGIAMNSMYFLGGTAAECEERRQAHLPLLLHPQPREVLLDWPRA
jgi:spermidine synthase